MEVLSVVFFCLTLIPVWGGESPGTTLPTIVAPEVNPKAGKVPESFYPENDRDVILNPIDIMRLTLSGGNAKNMAGVFVDLFKKYIKTREVNLPDIQKRSVKNEIPIADDKSKLENDTKQN